MNLLLLAITVPLVSGLLCILLARVKGLREALAVLGAAASAVVAGVAFSRGAASYVSPWEAVPGILLKLDDLSRFILVAIAGFGFLTVLYSLRFMQGRNRLGEYYGYVLWSIAGSFCVVLANHLILLVTAWGFLGLLLYLLVTMGGPQASSAAKKTLVIVGGTDALMVMGVVVIDMLAGTLAMDSIRLDTGSGGLAAFAFLALAVASFAKAGAMPFHSWIPDMAVSAPIPATAFMPASLDKLLGIYLLYRAAQNLFVLTRAMVLMLLIVGSVTIVAAVLMALIQHDLKRLLSYHAVSQVGYMVLGIGTMNPVGIAGGLFHMLNHAIYKACLFLGCGAVEHRTGKSELDSLGGLARTMPLTFVSFFVASLAISGVPPFNGFVSKWMVYQGIIGLGQGDYQSRIWFIWLVAAMFGSALTLASFMKAIHAVFLGRGDEKLKVREVPPAMWIPMAVLAAACVILGVFAWKLPFGSNGFIERAVPQVESFGTWQPVLATVLIIIGIVIGGFIYLLGRRGFGRVDSAYVGGEVSLGSGERVTGVDFYQTIRDFTPFGAAYRWAERKFFDLYDWGKGIFGYFTEMLRAMHTGFLPSYITWVMLGLFALLLVFVR